MSTSFNKWIITITVITAAVLELIDTSIVNVALSEMSGNLGATLEDTAWVITAYAIANVIIIPMTSFLALLFGRRRYYIGSIVLFTAASFACGNAHGIWELVAFRFIQGIGGGALLSTSQAILFEAWPVQERGIASGIFGLGIVIGPTIGPTLGGWIVDNYSWPWIFYVNIPVGIAAALLAFLYVPEPEHRPVGRIDVVGILLLIVGIGTLQTVLERGETEDWFATTYITVFTFLAVTCLTGFVWWELRVKNPVVDLRVLKSRTLAVAAFLTFCLGVVLFSSVFVVPVYAQRILGMTAMQTGLLLLPGAMTAAAILPQIGRQISKGRPPEPFVVAGFLFSAIFCAGMSRQSLVSGSSDFFWPLIMRGLGIALLTVPLTNLAVSDLAKRDIPQGSALNNMMRQLGGSFGIAGVNTYLTHREAVHRTSLLENVNLFNPNAFDRIQQMTATFARAGVPRALAQTQAYGALEGTVIKQTLALSFLDAFRLTTIICLVCIPLVLLVSGRKRATGPVEVVSDH